MTYYVSLGHNCQTKYHIKRANLPTASGPFDSSFTTHQALLKCLATDFEDVFKGRGVWIECHHTDFRWGHRPKEWLADEFFKVWKRQTTSFLSLKGADVVFIRNLPSPDKLEKQYSDISRCLAEAGYRYRLIFTVNGECPQTENIFSMMGSPDSEHIWHGCTKDWDKVFDRLA